MLKKVLSPESCAKCRFCCSFRRQSLWETPLFDEETVKRLNAKYPGARFKRLSDGSFTINIDDDYKTDDSEEEALCPFNKNGCILSSDEKPFDCSIWPLRVMRRDDKLVIALTPTCPSVNELPLSVIRELVENEIGETIIKRAESFPQMIKGYREGFAVLYEYEG